MTGQVVVFKSIGKAVLQEFDLPELKPDEAMLENAYTVISAGTERANLLKLPNSLRLLPDVFEIVGVVDDRDSPSAKFAGSNLKPYEGLKWLTEDELFHTPGLQAVTVETPNFDLVPTALRCMEHNLPMHMDKPGGENLALFQQLLDSCKARGLPFQMGYMFRGNPAMQWCLKAVRNGWLGVATSLKCRRT
jgi:predicted dehydrogenase